MKELVSITRNGSWYQIGWMDKKSLLTNQIQGYKNLISYAKYVGVKHTSGTPLLSDIKVDNLISMLTVSGNLTDKEQFKLISQRLNDYLNSYHSSY